MYYQSLSCRNRFEIAYSLIKHFFLLFARFRSSANDWNASWCSSGSATTWWRLRRNSTTSNTSATCCYLAREQGQYIFQILDSNNCLFFNTSFSFQSLRLCSQYQMQVAYFCSFLSNLMIKSSIYIELNHQPKFNRIVFFSGK